MRKRRFCRIDRNGCIACGGRTFEPRAVIGDALASAWELSAQDRADFDEREGHACATCQMSKRVRMLLWSIRRLFPSSDGLRVLHFNQINHLSPALRALGNVTETCYQQGIEHGAKVGELLNEDICHLTFPGNHFDLAIHSETLEHLFDFSRGLSEVARVLKPGGVQIYTVPLLHNRSTRQRMQRAADGNTLHRLPTSYHGNEGEFPVVWEFGSDFFEQRQDTISEMHYDNYWRNKTVFTVVERKP
jgi:SAM-dependent methyltransferase